ncbi:MAG: sugar transporter [Bacteroidales bacterium]|nr:sugar transporter [Bacteroidales bacterium]
MKETDSRVTKTLLNVRVNMICYFAAIIVSFFTRKIFLDRLGDDFIGLTTTINSLLSFLNLAELGVGASIAYFLYKPLYAEDHDAINELISIMGYLYRVIGLFILSVGLIFSLFLPLIFKDTPFSMGIVFYCFYGSLFTSLLGYFVNYKANTIFNADQRAYLVSGYFQLTQLTLVILQAVLALKFQNFVLFISLGILFAIINSVILNWKYKKVYPDIEADIPTGRQAIRKHPEIIRYVKNVFIHQIGGFINSSVMPTVIYGFASLGVVTLYSNYTLVNSKVQALIASVMGGSGASVGNLIAEGNKERIYRCFKEMFSIKFLFVSVMGVILYKISSPFICVWLGKEYVISHVLVLLVCADFTLNMLRETTDEYLYGYGLRNDIWVPIARVSTLALMVLAGHFWGLVGILSIPVAFQLLVLHTWKPYYLYRSGFQRPITGYLGLLAVNIVPVIVAYILTMALLNLVHPLSEYPENWMVFLTDTVLFAAPFAIFSLSLAYLSSEGIRLFFKRMKEHVQNRISNSAE